MLLLLLLLLLLLPMQIVYAKVKMMHKFWHLSTGGVGSRNARAARQLLWSYLFVPASDICNYNDTQWHNDGKRRRGKEWGAERTRRTFSLTDPNSTNTLRNCLWESSDNNLDSTKYTQTTWQNKQTREGVYIQISVYIYVYIRLYLYLWMRCLSVCVSVGPLKPCQKQPQAHEHTNKNRQ